MTTPTLADDIELVKGGPRAYVGYDKAAHRLARTLELLPDSCVCYPSTDWLIPLDALEECYAQAVREQEGEE